MKTGSGAMLAATVRAPKRFRPSVALHLHFVVRGPSKLDGATSAQVRPLIPQVATAVVDSFSCTLHFEVGQCNIIQGATPHSLSCHCSRRFLQLHFALRSWTVQHHPRCEARRSHLTLLFPPPRPTQTPPIPDSTWPCCSIYSKVPHYLHSVGHYVDNVVPYCIYCNMAMSNRE